MRNRALIYVRGTAEEIDTQLDLAYQQCRDRGYEVAAVFRDLPGVTDGWHGANRLLRHHQAEHLIVASTLVVPDLIESVTGSLPGPRLRPGGGAHRATRRRRIRPVPRQDAGA